MLSGQFIFKCTCKHILCPKILDHFFCLQSWNPYLYLYQIFNFQISVYNNVIVKYQRIFNMDNGGSLEQANLTLKVGRNAELTSLMESFVEILNMLRANG